VEVFKRLKERSREIVRYLPILCIAYRRKDVPVIAKIIIIAAIFYGLSPIDLIPDFIPVLGLLDDLIILPILIYLSVKMIPKEILEKCRIEAEEGLNPQRKKWYYALAIVTVWIVVGAIILKYLIGSSD
jgi:uncharacterized membrane protein YkvA (DUF1232 family)